MAEALELDLAAALTHLQALLGKKVCVVVNVRDAFSGCTIEGGLMRVVSIAPDQAAVQIIIGDDQSIILDPEDVAVLLLRGNSEDEVSLEFHLPGGVVFRLETA